MCDRDKDCEKGTDEENCGKLALLVTSGNSQAHSAFWLLVVEVVPIVKIINGAFWLPVSCGC